MKIFILGATGFIGSAVVNELLAYQHDVTALAHHKKAEDSLKLKGVKTVNGDLRRPELWIDHIFETDAIIHVAATFTDDMGDVEQNLLQIMASRATEKRQKIKLIYTGGCWLYGQTGNHVATEKDAFNPIEPFKWSAAAIDYIQNHPIFEAIIIHPGMVYNRDGGTLDRFITCAKTQQQIEVWGSLATRWPVVHCQDLAQAYRLAAESHEMGQSYNVSGQDGVAVGDMIASLENRFKLTLPTKIRSPQDAVEALGEWAIGYALDQQMNADKIKKVLHWQVQFTDIVKEIS